MQRSTVRSQLHLEIGELSITFFRFPSFSDSPTMYHLFDLCFQIVASLTPVVVVNTTTLLCSNTITGAMDKINATYLRL
jgi:hypothetical protein